MLDGWAKTRIEPFLNFVANRLAKSDVSANSITLAGFLIGVGAALAIACGWFLLGALAILASRICDGLDGSVARLKGATDFGGLLDIVLDFAFYGMIPLAFIIADPSANAIAGGLLLACFYANGASFLAFAIMAEKRQLSTQARGEKSFFFTTGLAEASETIAIFLAMCLLPGWFATLAYLFAAVTAYTTLSRLVLAARVLSD